MPRPASSEPTQRELEILHVLWELGPSPLGEIRQRLSEDREIAATTVATMLGVMKDKRLVTRRNTTRGYQWSARVTHNAAASGMIGQLVDRLFDGSASRMVAHLMQEGELSRREINSLRDLMESGETTLNSSSQKGPTPRKKTSKARRKKS